MPKAQPIVFVFWGRNFEETPAVLFTTELRRAGNCVKIVGIDGDSPPGAYGISLKVDLTLSEGLRLAQHASCVILPCSEARLEGLRKDPRVIDFFTTVNEKQAKLLIRMNVHEYDSQQTVQSLQSLVSQWFLVQPEQILVYCPDEHLISFAYHLSSQLVNGLSPPTSRTVKQFSKRR